MYSIIIVDDEQDIRQGILETVDWPSLGYAVVGEAQNAQEAIALIEALSPDVVLTDIRMPGGDGVLLMQYVRENYPFIKVVVSSGYSDFQYLDAAIKNDVFTYLLKPTNYYEFQDTFLRLNKELDLLQKEKQLKLEMFRQKELGNLLVYSKLLQGQALSADDEIFLGNCLKPETTHLVVVAVGQSDLFLETYKADARNDVKNQIANALTQAFGMQGDIYFVNSQNIITGFIRQESIGSGAYRNTLAELEKQYSVKIGVGDGGILGDIRKAGKVYAKARANIDGRTISCDSAVQSLLMEEPEFPLMADINKAFLQNDIETLYAVLLPFFDCLNQSDEYSYEQVDFFCMKLMFRVSDSIRKIGPSLTQVLAECNESLKYLYEIESIKGKQQYVFYIMRKLLETAGNRYVASGNQLLVQEMTAIIDENYCDTQLSLSELAFRLKKSPAYLSTIFKKEQGESYLQYLRNKRLERAAAELCNSRRLVQEVAIEVGYTDISSFIKYFKIRYGVTPAEYQGMHVGKKAHE